MQLYMKNLHSELQSSGEEAIVKAPGDVKKEGTWGCLGTPRKVSRNACFILVGACFFEGVTDNRHLDTCATINEFATHKKFCPLKKQALRNVKPVHLLHLDQHGYSEKIILFVRHTSKPYPSPNAVIGDKNVRG